MWYNKRENKMKTKKFLLTLEEVEILYKHYDAKFEEWVDVRHTDEIPEGLKEKVGAIEEKAMLWEIARDTMRGETA